MADAPAGTSRQVAAITRLVRRNSAGLPGGGISRSKSALKRTGNNFTGRGKGNTSGGGTITRGGLKRLTDRRRKVR